MPLCAAAIVCAPASLLACEDGLAAKVISVVDGDTLDAELSASVEGLGVQVSGQSRVRLYGVDAPEMHGASRKAGIAAREFLSEWIGSCSSKLVLLPHGRDKYGRILGELRCGGQDASNALLSSGNARHYDGGPR